MYDIHIENSHTQDSDIRMRTVETFPPFDSR